MRPRYLLIIGAGGVLSGTDLAELARNTELGIALVTPSLAVLASDHFRILDLGHDQGAILGRLFQLHGPPKPIQSLSTDEARPICADGGDHLLRTYWGGYVAALRWGCDIRVIRDPSGALPCYRYTANGVTWLASDIDLLCEIGSYLPELDWPVVERYLYSAGLAQERTALAGIMELNAGTRQDIGLEKDRPALAWSPWTYTAIDDRTDPTDDAERLGRIVQNSVQAWATDFERPLIGVSGGLDSSIVTACLAKAGKRPLCVTMFTDDPGGDERQFARSLCRHLDLELIERRYDIGQIDLDSPISKHLPNPVGRTQGQAYDAALLEIARSRQVDAFFSGNGGDNVFGYSQSAAPIVDRLICEGVGAGVVRSLVDVIQHTRCGPFEAVSAAAGMFRRRARPYRWQPNLRFLSRDMIERQAKLDLQHVWLDPPSRSLPGKAAHVASLVRAQPNLQPPRGVYAPVINPLLSQPIMEACLTIPSWRWAAGGTNRAVVRNAFAHALPQTIINRRYKGSPDGFSRKIVDVFRTQIRERLLDGRLAEEGLLDRESLDGVLAEDRFALGDQARILDLVDTEAWINYWSTRSSVSGAGVRAPICERNSSQ